MASRPGDDDTASAMQLVHLRITKTTTPPKFLSSRRIVLYCIVLHMSCRGPVRERDTGKKPFPNDMTGQRRIYENERDPTILGVGGDGLGASMFTHLDYALFWPSAGLPGVIDISCWFATLRAREVVRCVHGDGLLPPAPPFVTLSEFRARI